MKQGNSKGQGNPYFYGVGFSKIQDLDWIKDRIGVGQLNNSQLIERIRELESVIGEALVYFDSDMDASSLPANWCGKARDIVYKGEQEEGTWQRIAHGNISMSFNNEATGDERQHQIGLNLLKSFDRAGLGASLFSTGITITYQEEEVSNWENIYIEEPDTKASKIVKRWMNNNAGVGFPSRIH